MAERHTLKLVSANRVKAYQGIEAALAKAKRGEKPWMLELRERTRTDDQNDALHGLIAQILRQRPTLNGLVMDKVSYKATFMQALGHEVKMLPTLDGTSFFPLGLSTSKLTVGEFADLITFVLAWCAEQELTIKHFDGAEDGGAKQAPPRAA